jgi:phosphoribosylformylglycinamidine cyclo-ligase
MSTYQEAGVNITAGEEFVDQIRPLAQSTHRKGVLSTIGGFGAVFDIGSLGMRDPLLVSTTDGVGTKLSLVKEAGTRLQGLGQDLVAMCVNDLVTTGATPLYFLDYLAVNKLDPSTHVDIVEGIAEACRTSGCALVGGETAEMPGVYSPGDFDLAGFAVGAVERNRLLPKNVSVGDAVIALPSSGVHSNGFSLVRKILHDSGTSLDALVPWDLTKTFGQVLSTPTALYVSTILELHTKGLLTAAAHITGGGLYSNLKRVLPSDLDFEKTRGCPVPEVFRWLQTAGHVSDTEMHSVFNMGVGMCLISNQPSKVVELLWAQDQACYLIGHVINKR